MDDSVHIPEPLDLAPELQRESRAKDILLMRDMDERLGVERHDFSHPLMDLNVRLMQYRTQFQDMSEEARVLQALQDFKHVIGVLQSERLDIALPVAMNPKDGTLIYFNDREFI